MTTFNTTTFRALTLVPIFAAFTVHAANARADQVVDTQTQVQSVLRGTAPVGTTGTRYFADSQTQAQGLDVQAQTRRVLLGETNPARPATRVASASTPANADMQGRAQSVLLGHGI